MTRQRVYIGCPSSGSRSTPLSGAGDVRGQRVIANTIKAELPEGFQKAEFLLDHGFIDMIVHRKDLRSEISRLIDYTMA